MASKRVLFPVLTAALMAVVAVSLTAFGSGGDSESTVQEQTEVGVAVEVKTVETDSISNENRVSGRVSAENQTPVMVAVNAPVDAVYVKVGDTVEAGDPICALDMSSTVASYNAAVISRDAALQSYSDQAAVFNKQIGLYADQSDLIQSQIEFYESQLESSQSQIELAQSQVNLARSQVSSYESQIAVAESQIMQAEKNVRDTEALLEIGAASQLELDQAKMTLDQAQVSHGQLQMALEQAQMNVEQAQLGVEQAQQGVDQIQLGVGQAEYELSQIDLAKSSAQAQRNSTLSQLEAGAQNYQATVDQLAAVLANVDDSGNVIAPVSGVISSLSAVERSMVSATSPIAVIDEVDEMKVTVSVSETIAPKIAAGDAVDVSVGAVGAVYTGTIRNVERTANVQTGLYGVTVSVPADVTGLLAGMFADVTFYTDTSEDAVVIPTEAILSGDNVQYVFVVENGTAKYTEVTTGLVGNGTTEILTGLSKGQQLVTVGQSYLHDGDSVRIVSGGE